MELAVEPYSSSKEILCSSGMVGPTHAYTAWPCFQIIHVAQSRQHASVFVGNNSIKLAGEKYQHCDVM